MTRISFFLTTLIAAVPAAFLAFLGVMAFLQHSDTLTGSPALLGVVALVLLLSVAVVALPVAVLLRKGEPKAKEAAPEKAEAAGEDAAEEDAFGDGSNSAAADENLAADDEFDAFEDADKK